MRTTRNLLLAREQQIPFNSILTVSRLGPALTAKAVRYESLIQ
jgi:hypothetical protein